MLYSHVRAAKDAAKAAGEKSDEFTQIHGMPMKVAGQKFLRYALDRPSFGASIDEPGARYENFGATLLSLGESDHPAYELLSDMLEFNSEWRSALVTRGEHEPVDTTIC